MLRSSGFQLILFSIFALILQLPLRTNACQSCLAPSLATLRRRPEHVPWGPLKPIALASTTSGMVALRRQLQSPILKNAVVGAILGACTIKAVGEVSNHLLRADKEPDTSNEDGDESIGAEKADKAEKPPLTSAMVATIGVYKNFISPLLPPACRFLPTCSQYGVQAIEEFGPTKGSILTAWRLLRCSPIGGKGYDPPRWPPVSYTYSSY